MKESRILALLDGVGQRDAQAMLTKATRDGEALMESMVLEAQKRQVIRDKKHQDEALFLKKRETIRAENKAQQVMNEKKLQLIDQLLDEVLAELESMDEPVFIDLLERSLAQQNTDENPRIFVSKVYFDAVVKHLGRTHQVIMDENLDAGFVLSYQHFNVNKAMKQIIHHRKDELTQVAMSALFGEPK